jgi:type I restriction enzyme, S subunit
MAGDRNQASLDELVDDIVDRRGVTPLKLGSDFVAEGFRVISAKAIKDGRVDLSADEPRFVDEATYRKWMKAPLRADDVILTSEAPLGEPAYLASDAEWCLGQRLFAIRTKKSRLNGRFLFYALQSEPVRHDLLSRATGTTAQGIRQTELRLVRIPLPGIDEQLAIAHILGTLDDKIELNRRMSETLEAMARALFKSWFVDFDPVRAKAEGRDPGLPKPLVDLFPACLVDSELGQIPEGWQVKTLSQICRLGRGASPRPINEYMNGDVPWVKIADATDAGGPFLFETKEKVTNAGAEMSVAVMPGDLILSNSATCGIPMFVELHGCIHDGWLWFRDLQSISKIYLFHVLAELAGHLVQIADGSVQKNLNTTLVGQQNVLVPPKALVDAFDVHAMGWFAMMRQNGLQSRILAALRDALLPKLISGELRIEDSERVIARVV